MRVFCRATLKYMPRVEGRGGGLTDVTIRDGRDADLPGWQACGFELLRHKAAVFDWTDDAQLTRYHRNMAALARELTGCDRAIVCGHTIRGPDQAARNKDMGPITNVHSDFADSYGESLRRSYRALGDEVPTALGKALDEAGIDGDMIASARRLLVLNFWRNLGAKKMDLPLAFCDARTVPRADTSAFPTTSYPGEGFEPLLDWDTMRIVAPDPVDRHEWYAFPEIDVDEVVASRQFDTDRVGTDEPYWTPHGAFRDPQVELGQPGRRSIELRVTCVFF